MTIIMEFLDLVERKIKLFEDDPSMLHLIFFEVVYIQFENKVFERVNPRLDFLSNIFFSLKVDKIMKYMNITHFSVLSIFQKDF